MTPAEVLDAQGDLIDRLDDARFRGFIRGMMANPEQQAEENPHIGEVLQRGVRASYAYKVSHDMSMVVEHAANQLEPLDRFDRSLAPTGCGIVHLDRPLPLVDVRGKTMLVHWIVWGPIGINEDRRHVYTAIWMFNDVWKKPDEVWVDFEAQTRARENGDALWEQYTRISGRWATVGFEVAMDEQRLGPMVLYPGEEQAAKVLAEEGPGFEPNPGTNPLRYVHALWLLLGQTVTRVVEEEPDRAARRRAVRRKLPPKVSVIRLRREEVIGREPGESDVEWAHRWIVRGHWRWQHVGPHHPMAQEVAPGDYRARIWIAPYVKGPEGAPLVQSEKVYALER